MASTIAPVSTTEIGWAGNTAGYWASPGDEETPELQWPNSTRIYDLMRRQDAQVSSVLRAVTLPVRRTTWRLDPAGARPEVVALVAEDLGLPLQDGTMSAPLRTRDRFSWSAHLRTALLMLPYGHMYFEQVYRIDERGQARLRKLAPRMPRSIAKITVARDGGLVSITQHMAAGALTGGTPPPPIPVTNLVAYINDQEAGNWLGSSVLRSCYKHWLVKDRLIRTQAQSIDRNGMGVPLYTGAPGETDLEPGRRLAEQWRSGASAGAAIPDGADLVLRGVEGQVLDADKVIRYHDESIARAVLAHFLNLGDKTGSYALGSTFADFFIMSLQTLADQVADIVQAHVIEDLVDANWGPDERAPQLVFDEIGSRRDATAEAIRALLDSGAITADPSMEQFLRITYGLPPRTTAAPVAVDDPQGAVA